MKSEEIIIDGVNVAGCYYMYDNEDLNYMCQNGIGNCICKENKNCYYKQLKRLEKENEKLKHIIKDLEEKDRKLGIIDNYMGKDLDYWINLNDTNNRLVAKCNQFEKENEDLKKTFVDIIGNIRKENYMYYKALEEIRECAKTEISEIMTRADYDGFLALKGILAKIDEVLK